MAKTTTVKRETSAQKDTMIGTIRGATETIAETVTTAEESGETTTVDPTNATTCLRTERVGVTMTTPRARVMSATKGHEARNCPGTRCYNCDGFGHIAAECAQPRNVRRRTIQPQAAQAQPILSGPNRTAIPTPPTQPMSPEALMAFVQHQQQ
jgi:hypothetical protein